MAIEPYVNAVQSGTFDASMITDLNHFLVAYEGKTLFKHIADHENYLSMFNDTLTRFAVLVKEHPPNSEARALFESVFDEGVATLLNRINKDEKNLEQVKHAADFKPVTFTLSACEDYANKDIMAHATNPHMSIAPKDRLKGFSGHAPGIAYLYHYAPGRPLFTLDVDKVPPMLVSSLLTELLDFGIRNIRLSTAIKQPTSTLFTNPQETFLKKKIDDVTLHYFLVMGSAPANPFDLIVKPTGVLPGPLTLSTTAHKQTCAEYLVNALPCLLPNLAGDFHIDTQNKNPSLLRVDETDPMKCMNQLQQSLPTSAIPTFLWILFEDSHQKEGRSRYIYDIYLYADHIEPGLFTRSGCGDLQLLKQHMPHVKELSAVTMHRVRPCPATPPNSPRTPKPHKTRSPLLDNH